MSEQQQVTEEQFVLGQRMESLARQNAQQALRIADLEAQIALIQAKAQQPEQAEVEEVSDQDYAEVTPDIIN
jgi:cation transport ATPase